MGHYETIITYTKIISENITTSHNYGLYDYMTKTRKKINKTKQKHNNILITVWKKTFTVLLHVVRWQGLLVDEESV